MATQIRFLSGLKRIPRRRPPTLIVEKTWSVFVSITVIVPSRSLVTNASGPAGRDVQLVSARRSKKEYLPQRHKGAEQAAKRRTLNFLASSFAPLRLCGRIFFMELTPTVLFWRRADLIHAASRRTAPVLRSGKRGLREST